MRKMLREEIEEKEKLKDELNQYKKRAIEEKKTLMVELDRIGNNYLKLREQQQQQAAVIQACSCSAGTQNKENLKRQNDSLKEASLSKDRKSIKDGQHNCSTTPATGLDHQAKSEADRSSEELKKENEEMRVLVRSMLNTFTDILQNILVRKSMNRFGTLDGEYARTNDSKTRL